MINPRPSGNEAMYHLHALDLAEKTEQAPKPRLSELDLAAVAKKTDVPVTATARIVDDYMKRASDILAAPAFPSSPDYDKHKIITTNTNDVSCKDMESRIKGEIQDSMRQTDGYNGLHIVTSFIEFWKAEHKADPKLSEAQIFRKFEPDSQDEAKTHGTSCVGMAGDIVQRLKKINVEAHVIVESEGPKAPAKHAAVAVPCQDGILLIEAGNTTDYIITVKPKENVLIYRGDGTDKTPDLKVAFKIVEIPGNYKTATPLIMKTITNSVGQEKKLFEKGEGTGKKECFQFLLRPVKKPDDVMKRWLLGTNFYPVSSRPEAGEVGHSFKVNITNGTITFNVGEGDNCKKYRIPFAAFDLEKRTVDRSKLVDDNKKQLPPEMLDFFLGKENEELGGAFFKAFKTPKELLFDQIFNVVAHHQMLKKLSKK